MKQYILRLLFVTLIFLVSCKTEEKEAVVDYKTLSDQDKRLPENAMASMTVADGLEMNLFASEPTIANPTIWPLMPKTVFGSVKEGIIGFLPTRIIRMIKRATYSDSRRYRRWGG